MPHRLLPHLLYGLYNVLISFSLFVDIQLCDSLSALLRIAKYLQLIRLLFIELKGEPNLSWSVLSDELLVFQISVVDWTCRSVRLGAHYKTDKPT